MEWIADQYDNFQKHFQLQYGLELLSELESAVRLKNKSILDLGCGTGDLSLVLKERAGPTGHVTALDRDASMLSSFSDKSGSNAIDLIAGDFTDWPLPPGFECDVVFSNATFHWLRSYDELNTVFQNCRQCLTEQGHVAFRFSMRKNLEALKDFLEDALRDYCAQPDLCLWRSIFDFDDCLACLQRSNFSILHAEVIFWVPFTDNEMSFRWMTESQPILAYLEQDELESFHLYLRKRWSKAAVPMECLQAVFIGTTL